VFFTVNHSYLQSINYRNKGRISHLRNRNSMRASRWLHWIINCTTNKTWNKVSILATKNWYDNIRKITKLNFALLSRIIWTSLNTIMNIHLTPSSTKITQITKSSFSAQMTTKLTSLFTNIFQLIRSNKINMFSFKHIPKRRQLRMFIWVFITTANQIHWQWSFKEAINF